MAALPPSSPAGRALGMWSDEDEQRALGIELDADAARTLRVIASLLMPKDKAYDAEPPLQWRPPARPEAIKPAGPEMTRDSIDAAMRTKPRR